MTNFNSNNYIIDNCKSIFSCASSSHNKSNLNTIIYLDPAYTDNTNNTNNINDTGKNKHKFTYCYECWINLPNVPEKYRMNEWIGIFKCCNCYESNVDLFLDPHYTGDNEQNAVYCYKCWLHNNLQQKVVLEPIA